MVVNNRFYQVTEATEKEWDNFLDERKAAIEDISKLRQRVAEEEAKNKIDDEVADMETDVARDETLGDAKDGDMELDEGVTTKDETKGPTIEDKREDSVMGVDDDDAVEYWVLAKVRHSLFPVNSTSKLIRVKDGKTRSILTVRVYFFLLPAEMIPQCRN